MHEERMLRDLRAKLIEVGSREPGGRIVGVDLWVGALAHVDERQLRARWPETVAGTPAEGSRLSVTVSDDLGDPRAQGILLRDVTVESTEAACA